MTGISTLHLSSAWAKAPHILFINPGYADKGFWSVVGSTMRAAATEFGFTLTIVSADRNRDKMMDMGREAIETIPADYIILVNEHAVAPALLAKAEERRTPTLLLLNDLTPEQKIGWGEPGERFKYWIGSIAPDNRKAGREMAISITRAARASGLDKDGEISLLALAGDDSTPSSMARLRGLKDATDNLADLKLAARAYVNWSRDIAYRETKKVLEKKAIDVVWASNDTIAFGAMDALREAGRVPGKDVFVAGMNWSAPAIDHVINGEMTMTHGGHFLAGAWAVVILEDYRRMGYIADNNKVMRFGMTALQGNTAKRFQELLSDSDWSKIQFSNFLLSAHPGDPTYDFSLGHILRSVHKKPLAPAQ